MQKYFNITESTKIFILTPAGVVTGGVELLHQLCDVLNRNGANAYIVYQNKENKEIPDDYKKYNIKIADNYIDAEENIVVVPEVYIYKIPHIKKSQLLIWWMSVDNYFYNSQGSFLDNIKFSFKFGIESFIKRFIKQVFYRQKSKKYSIKKLKNNVLVCCHACQSAYALDFLKNKGFQNLEMLSDYINEDYVFSTILMENKKNNVLYNPKKGIKFTKKLIKAAPELNWIPIKNMTRAEVRQNMNNAKVYIDFGYHPGKDRMPREAAMCGCCIITGKLGAAGYQQDLSIEKEYKFNQTKRDIIKIVNKIRFELSNYETEIVKFEDYRAKISNEKKLFERDALQLLTHNRF